MRPYERVFEVFREIFPTDLEILVVFDLFQKREENLLDEFDFAQIKQSISNISKLPLLNKSPNIQVERIFKRLIGVFIERTPGNFARFVLTPHAERIVEIIINRIDNPYLKFPLKETFEAYFQLPVGAENDVLVLSRWFKLGFQNSARQVVIGHLDGLKLAVDSAIKKLNIVLETDALTGVQMLEEFTKQFQLLGTKAKEIGEAIRMKDDVYYSIRKIVENTMLAISKVPNHKAGSDHYQKLTTDIKTITSIRDEVILFFDKVDKQLDIVNVRLTFASHKITELQESLKSQSYYKLSLKKLLVYLLENSNSDREGLKLPVRFPRKMVVQEKFRFRTLRYWDMGFLRRATAFTHRIDEAYELLGRAQLEAELKNQATVRGLWEQAMADLDREQVLDLSSRFFEIVSENKSIEAGVQTAYELIRNISTETSIDIDDKTMLSSGDNAIHLWKMILKKRSSTS